MASTPAGIYDARDFGVVGNGIDDDGPAINGMLAALPEGSRIYFSETDYLINTEIVVTKDGMFFIGRGGNDNPDVGGRTKWLRTTAGRIITFDKAPGDPGQPVPTPANVVGGGGFEGIFLDGSSEIATVGLRVVSGHNIDCHDFMIRGCQIGIELTSHNGGATGDVWDHTVACRFEDFSLIQVNGTGIKVTGGTYSNYFSRFGIAITNAGIGVWLTADDDMMFHDYSILCQNVLGTQVMMEGSDFGGSQSSASQWAFGYFNGVSKRVRLKAATFDVPARSHLFLGLGTVDGEVWFDADKGAEPNYVNIDGRHNLRLDHRTTASVQDDFIGGGLTSGAIGSLGWTLTGGTLVRSTTGANHVGAVALGTSAVAGTLAALTTLDQAGGNFLCQETFDGAFVFRSDSVDTDTLIRVGFASAHNLDPATDGCWIEKLYADAAWYAVCRSAGVQTRVQMGSTALAAAAAIGAVNIKVNSVVTGIREGSLIWIGGENHTVTVVGDAGATGSGITFTPALTAAHSVGETVARLCQTNEWVSVRIRRVNNEAIGFTLMEYGTGNNNSRGQVNGNDSVRITTNIPSLVELQSGFWVKNQAAAVKLIRPDYFSLHIKGLRR